MKQKIDRITAFLLFLMAALNLAASDGTLGKDYDEGKNYLEQFNPIYSSDEECSYAHFKFEISESGCYHAGFWLESALINGRELSKFYVYKDGIYVGRLTPEGEGWQLMISDFEQNLEFDTGTHWVTIATQLPETPHVECMRLSLNEDDASIPTECYDNYMAKCEYGNNHISIEDDEVEDFGRINAKAMPFTDSVVLPLEYTYLELFDFKEGEYVEFITNSGISHTVDIVYYGYDKLTDATIIGPIIKPNPGGPFNPNAAPALSISNIFSTTMVYATETEMLGLNWLGKSSYSSIDKKWLTDKYIRIPKTGKYLVRIRSRYANRYGKVNLTIKRNNKTYEYTDKSISYRYATICILKDDYFTIYAKTTDAAKYDPVMFLHSDRGNRIMCYNDDCATNITGDPQFSKFNPCIDSKAIYPFEVVSVSSAKSISGSTTVRVSVSGMGGVILPTKYKIQNETSVAQSVSDDDYLAEIGVGVSGDALMIQSNEPITDIEIFNLNGILIKQIRNILETDVRVEKAELSSGVYVLKVKTLSANGVTKITI